MSKKQQIHKRLSTEQVSTILEHYLSKEITLEQALEHLQLKRARFFKLLKQYKEAEAEKKQFDIFTPRTNESKKISKELESIIVEELEKEQKLIQNKNIPVKNYNYSAVRDDILEEHNMKVSVTTIINRAKEKNFHLGKKPKKIHDREVLTNCVGELIQHDSSYHQWSPFSEKKYYLITSIDDYSRFMLYADIVEKENTWEHILALESVILKHGCPFKYYPDQHSIFRYVKDRDKFRPWHTYTKFTDEVDTQFKQVLDDCKIGITYALSPQAKGKVERPYQWIQNRIVRTCAKEGISNIQEIREILRALIRKYNYYWIHSTTKEIPAVRFERAITESKTLFRPFKIQDPFQSSKDIFCLRDERMVNAYRKISIHTLELTVPKVPPRDKVELRIVPDYKKGLAEVRMWFQNELVSVQNVKHSDLRL